MLMFTIPQFWSRTFSNISRYIPAPFCARPRAQLAKTKETPDWGHKRSRFQSGGTGAMTTTLSQPGLFAGTLVSVDYDQESAIAKALGGRKFDYKYIGVKVGDIPPVDTG